jgi:hypothetical protein
MSNETININGNEYAAEELSNEVVSCINRVAELRALVNSLQIQIVEANMAIESYSSIVLENLPEPLVEEAEVEEVAE